MLVHDSRTTLEVLGFLRSSTAKTSARKWSLLAPKQALETIEHQVEAELELHLVRGHSFGRRCTHHIAHHLSEMGIGIDGNLRREFSDKFGALICLKWPAHLLQCETVDIAVHRQEGLIGLRNCEACPSQDTDDLIVISQPRRTHRQA